MTDKHIDFVSEKQWSGRRELHSISPLNIYFLPEIQCRITVTPLHLGNCIVISDSILQNRQLVRQLRELENIGD